jgi:hypothetical protein
VTFGEPLSGSIGAQVVGRPLGSAMASAVENGRFEFKMVPPGRYKLQFWPKPNGQRQEDGGFYYPGTKLESAAVEIKLEDGTHVDGLQFTIP